MSTRLKGYPTVLYNCSVMAIREAVGRTQGDAMAWGEILQRRVSAPLKQQRPPARIR